MPQKGENNRDKFIFYKIEIGIIVVLLLLYIPFAVYKIIPSEDKPGLLEANPSSITGFVSAETHTKQLDISLDKSKNFVLTTAKSTSFDITALKLSGIIEGDGRVHITIENGLGQELTIFSNTKKKSKNFITGMFYKEAEENNPETDLEDIQSAWLVLKPQDGPADNPTGTAGKDEKITSGRFNKECKDTCFIKMPMDKDKAYKLSVKMDEGTKVKIDELMFTIE
jgi:hypothetical protein